MKLGGAKRARGLNRRGGGASEECCRLLARVSGEIVFDIDLVGKTIKVNENFAEKLGFRPDISRFLNASMVHPEDRPRFLACMEALKSRRTGACELRLMKADGRSASFLLVETGIFSDGGELVRIIGKLTDLSRQKEHEELLERRAMLDEMTGLYNRSGTQRLVSDILRDRRSAVRAMIVIDVDDFKKINDTFGHLEGDRTLKCIARALKAHFRSTDIVGRIGGDEFMALLSDAGGRAQIERIASLLCERIRALDIAGGARCSMGVCMLAGAPTCFDEMYAKADAALYSVKRAGGDGFAFFE